MKGEKVLLVTQYTPIRMKCGTHMGPESKDSPVSSFMKTTQVPGNYSSSLPKEKYCFGEGNNLVQVNHIKFYLHGTINIFLKSFSLTD